jgi:hypothetical protein
MVASSYHLSGTCTCCLISELPWNRKGNMVASSYHLSGTCTCCLPVALHVVMEVFGNLRQGIGHNWVAQGIERQVAQISERAEL